MNRSISLDHLRAEGNGENRVFFDTCVDVAGNSVRLHRSPFSADPVFYHLDKQDILFSDSFLEIAAILERRGAKLHPDPVYMSLYISYQAPYTSRTIYEEIKIVRGGETTTIVDSHSTTRLCIDTTIPTEQYGARLLRRTLERSIGGLDPKGTMFHISSGLDSSLLAILAVKMFGKGKVKLATCATRGSGCSDELDNVKRLADELCCELSIYDFRDVDIFAEGRELINNCIGYPIAHPSHVVEYMLDKSMVMSGAETIVNGKGPDDCLGGYRWHLPDCSLVKEHAGRVMTTPQRVVECVLKEHSDAERYTFWEGRSHRMSLSERLVYDVHSLTEAWNIVHAGIADGLKVSIVSPFMKREVRKGLFALPDQLKVDGQNQKVFLKQAFADVYPDYIVSFPKHGLRLDLRPYLVEYGKGEIFDIVIGGDSDTGERFNHDCIRAMIDRTIDGDSNYGWQLWSIFCLITSLS